MTDADRPMSNQARRASVRVGTTLKGKYRLDRVLGIGGMAVVYAATHRNQAEFAVKILHPEMSFHKDVCQRFLREGYAANSVKHPGVVMVVDDDTADDGAPFLVMELLRGDGVEALWEKAGKRMSPRVAVGIVDQLLDVLAAAHEKGIVHRDIKPANLFLTNEGVMKVLDFGIARARDALADTSNHTGTGMLLGTPAFMAPEQAHAKSSEIDAQTDVWAAGATLFSLISGEYVHTGDNAPQLLIHAATQPARSLATVAPNAPPEIVAVVARAIAFEKSARFPSAKAMQVALREASLRAFGGVPTREWLATARHESGMARTVVAPPPMTTPVESAANPARASSGSAPGTEYLANRPLGGTTAQPVLGEVASSTAAPRKSGAGPAIAISLFAVAATISALFFGGRALQGRFLSPAETAAPVLAAEPVATNTSVATLPAVPPVPTIAPLPAASASATDVASGTPAASDPHTLITSDPHLSSHDRGPAAKPTATLAAAATRSTTTKPTAAKPGCNTSFFFDAQGRKVYKPECL